MFLADLGEVSSLRCCQAWVAADVWGATFKKQQTYHQHTWNAMCVDSGGELQERKVQDPILVGGLEYCAFSSLFRMIIESV